MLFHTVSFAIFFTVVFTAYLFLNHRRQNYLLLAASLFFYAWWDWRFAGLLILSIVLDYCFARKMEAYEELSERRRFLILSLGVNLGILGIFKYLGFFSESLTALMKSLGVEVSLPVLHVLLPAGISFYTFQSISYVVDVYRKQIPACRSLPEYALFVSFFPQLIAGPIERAGHLIGQIQRARVLSLENFKTGCFFFFWGLFQKVYVADGLSRHVVWAFDGPGPYTASRVVLGAAAFSWQIYGDFAGYSNMARGLARMLGFDLRVNFERPYFSASITEYWRRWHISLSAWIRDYLYVPLGGRTGSFPRQSAVLALTMMLAGLWHGAAWTFVIWGAYHGVLLALERGSRLSDAATSFWSVSGAGTLYVFTAVSFGFILFRAHSIDQAGEMMKALFFSPGSGWETSISRIQSIACLILPLWIVEYFEVQTSSRNLILSLPAASVRWLIYIGLFHLIVFSGVPPAQQFIYFQF